MSVTGSLLAAFPTVQQMFAALPAGMSGDTLSTGISHGGGGVYTPPLVQSLFSSDFGQGPYDLWEMTTVYRWFEGIGMMPVAAPPAGQGGQNGIGVLPAPGDQNRKAAQIVRLSAPYGVLAVYWVARRDKLQPQLPMPIFNDNAVFAEAELSLSPPYIHQENTKTFSWSGVYLFLLKKPIWMLDGLNVGKSPAHTLQPSDNTVASSNFQKMF